MWVLILYRSVEFITLGLSIGRHTFLSLVLRDCGYHQADQDTDYLIFSCGYDIGNTRLGESWSGSHKYHCGLFNTSGDTVPGYEHDYPVIGSLND